ncbi:carbonic anhydrase family protein [Kaustia mangrovi]|uniref:Carbonic anhydrase n=1 Tax=Kaustia mangrovi TaxID=2593653 RepID=A0A7S8C5G6_9HYPH|nr:carbonic anhydrase family protein [Kaustia mangrovi]QPC43734.1 carbonic anhydrase family protein [Kaustia mangrovi]
MTTPAPAKRRLSALAALVLSVAATAAPGLSMPASGKTSWDYAGQNGPTRWSELDPAFETCGRGRTQSPVDIADRVTRGGTPLEIDYKPTPQRIVNNGHTIQLDYAPGSTLSVAGRTFHLLQVHFHSPSEHEIAGERYPMEVHFVNRAADGTLAVLAVLVERGEANPTFARILDDAPGKGEVRVARNGATIDASGLLPKVTGHYTLIGSLTTPPCTEGVAWYILEHPVAFSSDQIEAFRTFYPNNARPLQPLNGRTVLRN